MGLDAGVTCCLLCLVSLGVLYYFILVYLEGRFGVRSRLDLLWAAAAEPRGPAGRPMRHQAQTESDNKAERGIEVKRRSILDNFLDDVLKCVTSVVSISVNCRNTSCHSC